MEGFINIRLRPWLRRLITRLLAIIPAIIVVVLYGERGTGALLILSQVILSLQLSFAVFPLVMFTSDQAQDGPVRRAAVDAVLAWVVAVIIAALNVWLLVADVRGRERMYRRILVAVENSPADQAILDARAAARDANRRGAACWCTSPMAGRRATSIS